MTDIELTGPATAAEEGGISYFVKVDGVPVAVRVTANALRQAEPTRSQDAPVDQFNASIGTFLSIAEAKIRAGQIEEGVVWVRVRDLSRG